MSAPRPKDECPRDGLCVIKPSIEAKGITPNNRNDRGLEKMRAGSHAATYTPHPTAYTHITYTQSCMIGRRVKRASPGVTLYKLYRRVTCTIDPYCWYPEWSKSTNRRVIAAIRRLRRRVRENRTDDGDDIADIPKWKKSAFETARPIAIAYTNGLRTKMARPLQHPRQVEDRQIRHATLDRHPRTQRSRDSEDDGTPLGIHVRVHPPARHRPCLDAPRADSPAEWG